MDLIILAAGKGTRMNSSLPKALHTTIDNKNNIQNTIDKCADLVDNIFVVVNDKDLKTFQKNITSAVTTILPISSGLGSGHALYEVISNYKNKISNDFIVVWGDAVIIDNSIVGELISYSNPMCMPAIINNNPYVSFKVDDNFYAKYVDFSKYGETSKAGIQDKCLFKLNKQIIFKALQTFHQSTFKSGRYITESGEFEFLYVVHLLYSFSKKSKIKCYITDYEDSVLSYNTLEELNKIKG